MELIQTLVTGTSLIWQLSIAGGMLGQIIVMLGGGQRADRLWRALARVHQELWIVAPPGLILGAIHTWHSGTPWLIISYAFALWQWWHYRDWPDENRWKRRGRKLKDAVTVRAGRLVVVPT